MKIQGWRSLWLVGALAAAALIVASADAESVTYGVSVSKGCNSPVMVGEQFTCFYVFSNTQPSVAAPSQDTVSVVGATDSANRNPDPVTGPDVNILSQLQLVYGADIAGAGPVVCNGGSGLGTSASPYVGAHDCTIPYGAKISSKDFDLGTVTAQDAQAPGHKLHDQITFTWNDLCDVSPSDNCNPEGNTEQASAAATVIATSALTTNITPAHCDTPTACRVPIPVFDTAHLTGVTADAGGNITFELFDITQPGGAACQTPPGPIQTFSVPVTGPGDYQSPTVTIQKVASYGWLAMYSGDKFNTASTSDCFDPNEHAILNQALTVITTAAQPPTPASGLPATLTDIATLSGATTPATGAITFRLFSDNQCSHQVGGDVSSTVTGNGFITSPPITVTSPGTYYWEASYSGDINNLPAPTIVGMIPPPQLFTSCTDTGESVTISVTPPTMTTTASSATGVPANLTDVAHFSSQNANATGTLTFHLYSDNKCTAEVAGSPVTKAVNNGSGDYTSPAITVTQNGTYYWRVGFVGDASTGNIPLTPCGEAGEISQVGGTGQIEICKAPDNGAAGTTFTFTLTNVTSGQTQTVQVTGGTCSRAINVLSGKWQIAEDLSSGLWTVSGIQVVPNAYLVSTNTGQGSVKVKVVKNDETQVTFTDTPAMAVLKVCKFSSTPALQGNQFTFTVGQTQQLTATAGASQATAGCSGTVTIQPGSIINVAEAVPAGEQVVSITAAQNASVQNLGGGVGRVTIGPGVNVLYFDNEPVGPAQNGYIEICKDAGDQFVSGTFTFSLTDRNGKTTTVPVLAGQCSNVIKVPAGVVTVDESPTSGTEVTSITARPSSALGTTNFVNGTAIVNVPVSDSPTNQVEVHFTNSTLVTQVKVCKLLGPNSGGLADPNQPFSFTVTDDAYPAGTSFPVSIIATTDPDGSCKIVKDANGNIVPFPIGSTATVTEDLSGFPFVTADHLVQKQQLASGVNEIDFTNQAMGQFEVCKDFPDSPHSAFAGMNFSFSYQGVDFPKVKGTFTVPVDGCALPVTVPAGNYTVTETVPTGFAFVSATATGPTGQNRIVTGGNPATVSVPYYGAGIDNGEATEVHFLNNTTSGAVKVCKVIDPHSQAAIGMLPYQFTLTNQTLADGNDPNAVIGKKSTAGPYPDAPGNNPGQAGGSACVFWSGLPIIDPTTGLPYVYKVVEKQSNAMPATYVTTNIAPSGPVDVTTNNTNTGTVKFTFTGPGVGVFIYTNASPS